MISSRRFKRIWLLVQCFFRVVYRGRANKSPKNIQRVLVVPAGKLGDVVCTTPVLAAIRKHLPKVQIITAGNLKLHRPLLSDSGLVDEYIDLSAKGVVSILKESQIDAAFVTGPSFEPTAKLCAAGIPLVVAPTVVGGYSPSETRPYRILKKFIKTFPYHIKAYAPRDRLKALEPIGIFSDDTKKHLGFSKEAEVSVAKFFEANRVNFEKDFIVGISPVAGNKIKEWPIERFAKIADHVAEKYGAKVVMIGSGADANEINKTISHAKNGSNFLKATDFNLDGLKALVSKISLFISVDTGPIYIAEAFEVPTIDIVGPVDENVQPPKGRIHRNVLPPNRGEAQLSILNARSYNYEEALRQVLTIDVETVSKEIDSLISDVYPELAK